MRYHCPWLREVPLSFLCGEEGEGVDGVRSGGVLIIEGGSSAQPVADGEDNHSANAEECV